MNGKSTWFWLVAAVGLFGFIFLYEKQAHKAPPGPVKVLPELKAEAVTHVQVRPATGLAIQAERTNGAWELTQPQSYPAQNASVEELLTALEGLTPAAVITGRELRGNTNADEEYGLATPQATITVQQPGYHAVVQIGAKTAPGDQVFLRVVGDVFVVDAGILKLIPASADDWRDTALLDLKGLAFDHLSVTNGAKAVQFVRGATNAPWRLLYPLSARADNYKLRDALQRLESLRIQQFITDDAKGDLEPFGLQTPDLQLAFAQGTNPPVVLEFGKNPTNDARLVYARRAGRNAVVTVAADLLAAWRGKVNDFRDPYLLSLKAAPARIDVRGMDTFSLEQQINGAWRVLPQGHAADPETVRDMLSALNSLRASEFIDVVIEPDLPNYGLTSPVLRYTLLPAATNSAAGDTNAVLADLSFGTNKTGKAFARRTDEPFVYGIAAGDLQRLPSASWQMRDREVWSLSTNDIERVVIHQQGKVRQIKRNGPYSWTLTTPGSLKNELGLEETVDGLCHLTAASWVACGATNRAQYGLTDKGLQITLELKNGDKKTLDFGSAASSGRPYAEVTLEGSPWILEFPLALCRDVADYLIIPADVP
ncbi:MAG TPA: DUF4340 domain-containing protein [Candidatus Acidoferrum sp.]|nr:DUF4340 domain-containing protein [Candidatus Acidoferrum sp.]